MKRFPFFPFMRTGKTAGRAFALLLAALLAACPGDRPQRLAVGQTFPRLTLTGLERGALDTAALRGKVLVLNVWATWCPPCRREMPSLQRLAEAVAGERIVVIGLSVDRDANLAREYVLQARLTFPNYIDPAMEIANGPLAVVGFPETFVVGPDGKLAARVAGARDWDAPEMRRALEALYRGEGANIR